ncbi:hypothetical protein RJ55_05423 [Drechmeria coniospora]|nr:hypothetical protein RJ55_05423 [Drechmeria coniospora]
MVKISNKKRPIEGRLQRPSKKQKRKQDHDSESGSGSDDNFDAVNLLDSDDDIHNAKVDDAPEVADDAPSSSEDERPNFKKAAKVKSKAPAKKSKKVKSDDEEENDVEEDGEDEADDDEEDDDDDDDDSEVDAQEIGSAAAGRKAKSKRNDPTAFATSLSKILSTKLSSSKRSDPVLARSAAAHEASKAAVDNALEAKAKRQLKEQKRKALEKGRVKDVLLATNDEATGEPEVTTSEIMLLEKRLRKVAQRGVVTLFNAVRAAQVKAGEAEREVKKKGVIGMNRREEKVNEMTKKGFLDLIASGGGGLKKGGLEEA